MKEVRFLDHGTLSNVRRTRDGYLVADVRCARAGCQKYLGHEVGLDDEGLVDVYRPEEVVFSKKSLATYAGKPITLDHPPEHVNADNWKEYAVGETGDEVARDGEFVRVGIMVRDADAIRAIESGTREISMGYTTSIEHRDGIAPDGTRYRAVQVGPIQVNHLAVVDRARGGSQLRVGDGASTWGAAPHPTHQEDSMNLRTIVVDGLSIQVTDQGAQAIEKLRSAIEDRDETIASLNDQVSDLQRQAETKDGEVAALKRALSDATSPATIVAAVRARVALLDMAERKGKKSRAQYEEMDDDAIRRSVVADHLGDAAKEMSDEAIKGAFFALPDAKKMAIRPQDSDPWARFIPNAKGA